MLATWMLDPTSKQIFVDICFSNSVIRKLWDGQEDFTMCDLTFRLLIRTFYHPSHLNIYMDLGYA